MTKLLDQAFDLVRNLPEADQDQIAHAMLSLAQSSEGKLEAIDPAHLPDVLEGPAQASRREFATDAEIAAAFGHFDL